MEFNGKKMTAFAAFSGGGGGGSVELDPTLSVEGKAADAKAVGDALAATNKTVGEEFVEMDKTYPNGSYYGGYISTDGNIVSNGRYGSFYFEATKDFECYLKPEDYDGHAIYRIVITNDSPGLSESKNTSANVIAYLTNTNGNLPTEDNKLSVKKGEWVIVSYDRNKEENFHLYQNMTSVVVTKKYLKEDICLADTQIDQVLNKFAPIVSKEGGVLSIWLPLKRKNGCYAHITFKQFVTESTNRNLWKFDEFGIVNSSLVDLFTPQYDIEWTSVLRETDTLDFIGGYHGDETTNAMSLFLDGREILMSNADFEKTNFTELKIALKSTLNKCDTPDTPRFTRYQDIVVSADGILHTNRWVALADASYSVAYMGMMGFDYNPADTERVQYCRYNDGYIAQPVNEAAVDGSCVNFSDYANIFELWGNQFLARLTVIGTNWEKYKGTNRYSAARVVMSDGYATKTAKAYYQYNGTLTMKTGDELRGQWKHEFI